MTLSMPWKAVRQFFRGFWEDKTCDDCGRTGTWLNECNEAVCNHCGHLHALQPAKRQATVAAESAGPAPIDRKAA